MLHIILQNSVKVKGFGEYFCEKNDYLFIFLNQRDPSDQWTVDSGQIRVDSGQWTVDRKMRVAAIILCKT